MTNPDGFMIEKGAGLMALRQNHSVVHLHPNNCCGTTKVGSTGAAIPNVLELTLLRKDRLRRWGTRGQRVMSPHPLDIGWNVLHNRPLFLGPEFLPTGSFEEGQLRRKAIDTLWLAEGLKSEAVELGRLVGWPKT
jgi:hypothetical protein